MLVQVLFRHIHLAAYDGLEYFFAQAVGLGLGFGSCRLIPFLACFFRRILGLLYGVLGLSVFLFDVVGEFLDTIHGAVVGEGHAAHAVGHSLVNDA